MAHLCLECLYHVKVHLAGAKKQLGMKRSWVETRNPDISNDVRILLSTWIHEPSLIRWEPDTMDEALKGQRMTSNMTRWIKSPPSQVQCSWRKNVKSMKIYINNVFPYLKHTNSDTDPGVSGNDFWGFGNGNRKFHSQSSGTGIEKPYSQNLGMGRE